MAGWTNLVAQFSQLWVIRIGVLSSFAAHLLLILFAGIRRRKASGMPRAVLWLANEVTDLVEKFVIGKLFFGSTSRQQQLVAFWTPFLLMHLARPDNISAYSLEDNVLSSRQVVSGAAQVVGAIYVLIKHIIASGDAGTLVPASILMFLLGIVKYVERIWALWQGDLGSIRSSVKKLMKKHTPKISIGDPSDSGGRRRKLKGEKALQVAHDLFPICKHAFVDHAVGKNPLKRDHTTVEAPFRHHEWDEMWTFVEMELSLMYDILYTKAAVVHTRRGYIIRVASPVVTAVACLLFWFSKHGQRTADVNVIITYILLVGTFLLDVRWLLGALGSTWTYAFLKERCRFHRAKLWRGRRRRLRCFVVSLDLSRLSWLCRVKKPSSYRMWSGTIGQYNLLHESTRDRETETPSPLISWLVKKKIVSEDSWMEYQYHSRGGLHISPCVRKVLFERIWQHCLGPYDPTKRKEAEEKKKKEAEGKMWKEEEEKKRKEAVEMMWKEEEKKPSEMKPSAFYREEQDEFQWDQELRDYLGLKPEFAQEVLILHIATDMFVRLRTAKFGEDVHIVEAIEAVSNYMMFLVVVRPSMIPGLKQSSLHEYTRKALTDLWKGYPRSTTREKNLAEILRDNKSDVDKLTNIILPAATKKYAKMVRKMQDQRSGVYFILDEWVRILIIASISCSRESHAKQLSCGGDLTTIVWILTRHAGIIRKRPTYQ